MQLILYLANHKSTALDRR